MTKTRKSDSGKLGALFEGEPAAPGRPIRRLTLIKLLGVLALTGLLGAMVLLPYFGGMGLAAGGAADRFLRAKCDLHESTPPQRTTVYASDGKTVIANLFSQDRGPVALAAVPRILQQALIATEDRRFYDHHGVDLRGLLFSAVRTSNGSVQGGSTLTMQYVKEERFYQARTDAERAAAVEQNVARKIADARCALYLEETKKQSKDQILEKYLNIAFFGENAYGVQIAAQTYFDVKNVAQLKPWRSAMLVGDYLTGWLEDSSHGRRLSDRQLREGGLKIVSTLDVANRIARRPRCRASHRRQRPRPSCPNSTRAPAPSRPWRPASATGSSAAAATPSTRSSPRTSSAARPRSSSSRCWLH